MVRRRTFLKGLGLGALTAPLWSRGLLAADPGTAPTRIVRFPSMNGANYFYPNAGNLSAMSTVTEPLAAYQSQIQFVDGLGIEGSMNHFAVRSIFTGFPVSDYLSADPNVPSVDQVIASHLAGTAPTSLRSLHLGGIPADSLEFYQLYGRSTLFFAPAVVDYEANPVTAFDTVFGGLGTGTGGGGGGGGGGAEVIDRSAELHDAALDLTAAELGDLGARVDALPVERAKLDGHRAALAGLYRGRTGPTPGPTPPPPSASCDASPIASVEKLRPALEGNARAAYEHQRYSDIVDAQMDIIARALTCGLTRVATLQCGSADGNVTVPVDGGLPHHNTSHGEQMQFARLQQWYAGKVLRLVQALDVPDPLDPAGNTVLHNSVIVWLSECMPVDHGSDRVPCMYIGSAGGRLRTGGYTDVSGATNKHLLKTLARAFGVPDASTGHFGGQALTELLV